MKIKETKNILKHVFNDIKENYKVFIICFIISIFFAYFINTLNYENQIIYSDFDIKNLDTKYIIKNINTRKVKIYYRGKKDDIIFLSNNNVKPYIDLSKVKNGDNIVKVEYNYSYLPENLKVVKIEPEFIKVNIDIKIKKELKVSFNIKNEPAPGYIISDIIVSSKYVKVEGPKSLLQNLEYLQFKDIDIAGIESSEVFKLEPIYSDIVLISPENVNVYLEVKKQYEFFSFENLFIELVNKKQEFEYIINPSYFNIKILVPTNLINNLVKPSFVIDVSSFSEEGEYLITPNVKIDEKYEILSIEPKKFILKIYRASRSY